MPKSPSSPAEIPAAKRLDEALVARGLLPSRSQARDAVRRGIVRVNGELARKPAQSIAAHEVLSLTDDQGRYVSRAALKLIHALDHFAINPEGRVCLDLGASTGGFTQVLLERGAKQVIAIDVGHGQMAPSLTADPRVTLWEGLNARDLTRAHMPPEVSLIVCDISFISLTLALPPALRLAQPGTTLVALVKPQFEVGRENLGKGGRVADTAMAEAATQAIAAFLKSASWLVQEAIPSPLKGGDGNQEYLLAATKP